MEEKKTYEAVVFDMDGVIFDSERAVMDCWMELANKYHIENIEKPYFACIRSEERRVGKV